jgi:membrane associated rhomboid family serine protease
MVIPIGDLNPVRSTPWVMRALILANLVVFLLVQPWLESLCAMEEFFLRWAAVPLEVTRGAPLSAPEIAAMTTCPVQPVPGKNVYGALVTSMFLHADLFHLLGNMLFLWVFGNNVEDRLGHLGFAGFYVFCGFVASGVFVVANPDAPNAIVGASGAIAGVLGAYLVMFPLARVQLIVLPLFFLTFQVPALIVLGLWFLLQLRDAGGEAFGGGGVAYLAHVAGFATGAVVTVLLGFRPERPAHARRRRRSPPGQGW